MNNEEIEMKSEKVITVLTLTYPHEVAIIRGRLESEGIACFVQDELTIHANPLYSNAIGGIKLQVLESELKPTIEILKETGYIKEEDLQFYKESLYVNKHSDNQQISASESEIVCPICGSEEVVKTKKTGWFFLITSLLFVFLTPFCRKKYYCFNCKQEFKLKR